MDASFQPKLGIAGAVLLVVGIAVFGFWAASGSYFVTQYQVEQTVTETDEFGDEIERTVMEDEFRFGLFPDKPYDGAIVVGGLPLGVGAVLLVLSFVLASKDDDGDEVSVDDGPAHPGS